MRRLLSILVAILAAISLDAHAQRQLEPLGRGLVAVRTGTASTYIGWRLLGNDPENIAFNLYRSIGTSSPIKLNPQPLTNTTDFQDTTATFASSLTYHIRPVISGIEQPSSPSFTLPPPLSLSEKRPNILNGQKILLQVPFLIPTIHFTD